MEEEIVGRVWVMVTLAEPLLMLMAPSPAAFKEVTAHPSELAL